MRNRIFIVCIIFFTGCSKKEMKLPLLGVKGIPEVQNHSEIWMFLNVVELDISARVIRNHTISTTHWIFNTDRHLPFRTICDQLNDLKEKHENSVHSAEGMHNYLSYADTVSNQLSLFEFDKIIFNTKHQISKNVVASSISKETGTDENIHLLFSGGSFYINDLKLEKDSFIPTIISLFKNQHENWAPQLYLNFDQNLSYQNYLYYRTAISSINTGKSTINSVEYIFDKEKVPNCNCD